MQRTVLMVLGLLLTCASARGQSADERTDASHTAPSVTRHLVTIDGEPVRYTATAGTITLADEDGTARGEMFFIAYTRDGVDDPTTRPITFSFNGGPGSSSVWLHLGLLGPRRVDMGDTGALKPPPWTLIANEHSLLDRTDLVFIDPVTTGYSRAAAGEDDQQFHGVQEDIESVGEFIRLYLTRHERWASPKFLIGESYGTTRAAGLSGHLQDRHGIFLNGVMLVSSILDFQTARFDGINDLPYVLFLPTYTATAWYHGQLPDELQARPLRDVLDEVESFALHDYARALLLGHRLTDAERADIVRRLARYTGLSEQFIEQSNLRIAMSRFGKELLRARQRTIGRLDSRFIGIDRDHASDRYEYDPSYAAIQGPYTATMNDYARRELGYETDLPYEILTGRVRPWNYGEQAENAYLTVSDTLRSAMTKNPDLHVFIASGYYDLATPYFATEHTVAHLALDESQRDRISMAYYEAGHMMYIHELSLRRLKADLADFLDHALHR